MRPVYNSKLGLEDQILLRQMSDFVSNIRMTAFGTIASAIILIPTMARTEHAGWWTLWFVALFLFDGLRIKQSFDFKRHSTDPAYVRRSVVYATVLSQGCGITWAVAFVALWQSASTAGEYLVLCVLAAGIMTSALLQYRYLRGASHSLMLASALAGTGIAFLYPIGLAIPIVLLTWVHGATVLRGISDHSRFYRDRLIEEIELEKSEQTVRLLLHEYEASGSDWLWEIDAGGYLKEVTVRFAEAAQSTVRELADRDILSLFVDSPERDRLAKLIASQTAFRDLPIQVAMQEQELWWSVSGKPLEDGTIRGVMSDVTSQIVTERKLAHIATSDPLTGLANRRRINDEIVKLADGKASQKALFFIDLDKFKLVNDTLGHTAGDQLLQHVAKRILDKVSPDVLVARLGGDEFAFVTLTERTLEETHRLACTLIARLSEPFVISGRNIQVSASIGIAHQVNAVVDPDEWQQQADIALYAAKSAGRNCFRDYDAQLHELNRQRQELELDLRTALKDQQFFLVFQPQLEFSTGALWGREALVRWNHPERGIIMPDEFIELAEESGLITSLGEWIIHEAIHQAASWKEDITLALNLSSVQIRSDRIITVLAQALASSGISPDRVELEITETALLQDSKENIEVLHKIRALGVRIALDDFGTGYSSLNYLRSFPFDTIKIDRCFVKDLESRPDCQAIIRATVNLANELNMKTVAEGIEDRRQYAWLRSIGCTAAQGYFISHPVATDIGDYNSLSHSDQWVPVNLDEHRERPRSNIFRMTSALEADFPKTAKISNIAQ